MSARECVIPVFVPHLGCPHQCVFCDQRRISGSAESASAETVRQAISSAAALPRSGAKRQLAFYGGSFTAVPAALQEELLAVAAEAIARGELDAIRLSTRPDAIDDEVLARLRRFGVETVELGAQSMDDEVLRLSGRGHTAADVERAAAAIKAAGFRLILQMMTGLVGDSDEKDLATARRLIALRPEGVRIYPTVIVRGTPLWELWKRGEYREHTVEDAVRVCAKLLPLFEEAGIPVIRLGLNPTEELSGGEAAGGAYHSALGELVKSRVMLEKARALLKDVPPGSRVRLGAAERSLSQAIGQKKENLLRLREECGLEDVKVVPAALKEREIVLLSVENGEETRYNNTVIS
ncbi:MAG: radical SAM protein [Oscillospiraceae bacterium]|nr:radical SAM protein [Oscillospiraceae bacterium]